MRGCGGQTSKNDSFLFCQLLFGNYFRCSQLESNKNQLFFPHSLITPLLHSTDAKQSTKKHFHRLLGPWEKSANLWSVESVTYLCAEKLHGCLSSVFKLKWSLEFGVWKKEKKNNDFLVLCTMLSFLKYNTPSNNNHQYN